MNHITKMRAKNFFARNKHRKDTDMCGSGYNVMLCLVCADGLGIDTKGTPYHSPPPRGDYPLCDFCEDSAQLGHASNRIKELIEQDDKKGN